MPAEFDPIWNVWTNLWQIKFKRGWVQKEILFDAGIVSTLKRLICQQLFYIKLLWRCLFSGKHAGTARVCQYINEYDVYSAGKRCGLVNIPSLESTFSGLSDFSSPKRLRPRKQWKQSVPASKKSACPYHRPHKGWLTGGQPTYGLHCCIFIDNFPGGWGRLRPGHEALIDGMRVWGLVWEDGRNLSSADCFWRQMTIHPLVWYWNSLRANRHRLEFGSVNHHRSIRIYKASCATADRGCGYPISLDGAIFFRWPALVQ